MIIPIGKDADHVFAMGHRVRTDAGGVRELKRRCLESLMHLDDPPDEVVFRALWLQPVAHESGEHVAPGLTCKGCGSADPRHDCPGPFKQTQRVHGGKRQR